MSLFGLSLSFANRNGRAVKITECEQTRTAIGIELRDLKKETDRIPALMQQMGKLEGKLEALILMSKK